jgi:hypothetical protein
VAVRFSRCFATSLRMQLELTSSRDGSSVFHAAQGGDSTQLVLRDRQFLQLSLVPGLIVYIAAAVS